LLLGPFLLSPGVVHERNDRILASTIAETLGAIGPEARAAVPMLVPLVNPDGGGS
jgi:hypothetical protein